MEIVLALIKFIILDLYSRFNLNYITGFRREFLATDHLSGRSWRSRDTDSRCVKL